MSDGRWRPAETARTRWIQLHPWLARCRESGSRTLAEPVLGGSALDLHPPPFEAQYLTIFIPFGDFDTSGAIRFTRVDGQRYFDGANEVLSSRWIEVNRED
jgi:hypothetical protein